MNRARLNFATTAFLGEMRRQSLIINKEAVVKNIDEYPPEQVSALMSAIEKAVQAADPAADEIFANWQERKKAKDE